MFDGFLILIPRGLLEKRPAKLRLHMQIEDRAEPSARSPSRQCSDE